MANNLSTMKTFAKYHHQQTFLLTIFRRDVTKSSLDGIFAYIFIFLIFYLFKTYRMMIALHDMKYSHFATFGGNNYINLEDDLETGTIKTNLNENVDESETAPE